MTTQLRVILLHALPLNSGQWTQQMEMLPVRTIAPTLYSFGRTIQEWAAGVLDIAGDGPLIAVGNSVGGSCALEMARLAPDRIEGLVLIGTKAGHRPDPDFRDKFMADLERERETTVRGWVDSLLGSTASDATRRHVHQMALKQSTAELIAGVRVFHGRPDASDVLTNWSKPLMRLRGALDPVAGAAEPTITIPESGHYANLEQPASFDARLLSWLDSHFAR